MSPDGDYCAFTKAVENLGDRWSLMIVGELERKGTLGFNALISILPGISRSILADRLRKLDQLGLIARDPASRHGVPGYCVTPAGAQLKPVFLALKAWAVRWVPDDPAVAERDPDLIIWWLKHRLDPGAGPVDRVVLDLDIRGTRSRRFWIVLEPGAEASICNEDPCLDTERYVYIEADAGAIYPLARGVRSWAAAMADRSVEVFGDPVLVRALPTWFERPQPESRGSGRLTTAVA